jgi:succinate-semialdehyde dehydrogenase/glutarate-semialdehyde dehydrogenase
MTALPAFLHPRNFIAGHWQDAADGRRFDITDPATGARVAQVPDSGAAEARAAADAAHAAFPAWRAQPAKLRAQLLKKWHQRVLAHSEVLAELLSLEQGKPLAEARGEVAYAASYIEWFAEEATRLNGDLIPAPVPGRRMLAVKEPVGVVAAVTPWNFPSAMLARKIAPALAAGCTVVCKPAEDAPLSALALVALAHELAGEACLPPGVLNIVTASRAQTPTVVDPWLDDPRVRKLTFTGSTAVGKHLAQRAAGTLKRLSLELGGNAPFIVFEDAELDAAVEGLMVSKFRNGGQTCVCPNRVFVHERVHDEFVRRLVLRVRALRVGPATDPQAQIGPMINARAIAKIESHLANALAQGAKLQTGGRRLEALGPLFFAPTVLTDAHPGMACACEETFGPVVPITRFAHEAEVLRQANDTPFGLAGYFYSQDVRRIWRVADALEVGLVGINEGALAAEAAPFGGVKESGYGREGSVHGLDDYTQLKYLCQGGLGG